jgi:conjugal transfer mating pair stabilization protein TraG
MQIIYSYGSGEYLYYIFNFIAMLVAGHNGISTNVIRLVSLTSTLGIVLLMYLRSTIRSGIAWVVWFTVASFLIIGPRETVHIKDPISYGLVVKTVDNVPLILAMGASAFSSIGHSITEKIESVFIIPGSPQYFKYIDTGSLFGSKLIRKLKEVRVEDPIFNANLNRFVQQCVVYDAMIGRKYTLKTLRESNDIWNLVSSNASPVLGFLYKDSARNEIVTCLDGARLLNDEWNEVTQQSAGTQGARLFGSKRSGEPEHLALSARNAFLEKLPQSYRMFGGAAEGAADILKQQMMIHALREAPAQKANQLGNSYAVAKATLQQRNSYQIAGIMAEESLVVMRAVFEALIYGSFVFVYILIFLPSGYKVLGYYFQAICWVQLWAPLYAILNFILCLYAHYESCGILRGAGLTRANSAALIDLHTDISSLSGWLSLSVPWISFMLINKGGVSAFVNLATHLGSALGSSVSSAAAEKTSGNISLGNFSQGTTSLQTMSAHKYNTNADFQSGQFSQVLSSGISKITNPEGSVYLAGQGRTVSTFSTDIIDSKQVAMQLNKHAQQEKSLMEGKASDYSMQVASTQRDLADFMSRISNSDINASTQAKDESLGSTQAIQNAMDFSKKLQKKFGISETVAAELSAGINLFGFNGNVKSTTGISVSAEGIKDFAKNEGYKENFDSIVKATQGLKFDETQSKEKALVQQISSSYEKSNQLRESISLHQQKSERLGKAATFLESSNYDTRTVMTQEFLEYVANSKGMNSKGRIGYDTAASIVDATGGALFDRKQEFLQRFQEARTQRAVEYFSKNEIKEGTDLEAAFKAMNRTFTENNKLKLDHSAVQQHAREVKFEEKIKENLQSNFVAKENAFRQEKEAFDHRNRKKEIRRQQEMENSVTQKRINQLRQKEESYKKQRELDEEATNL